MVLPLIGLGVKAYLDKEDLEAQQAQQRREAQARILQSSASRLGAPTYNVDAARVGSQQAAQRAAQRRSNVANVVDFMGKQVGGSDEDVSSVYDAADSALADYGRGPMDRPSAIEQDYLNNPPVYSNRRTMSGGQGYGGDNPPVYSNHRTMSGGQSYKDGMEYEDGDMAGMDYKDGDMGGMDSYEADMYRGGGQSNGAGTMYAEPEYDEMAGNRYRPKNGYEEDEDEEKRKYGGGYRGGMER